MPTKNVVLTDRQASVVDDLVGSGRYQNASEVLREGLRLVERREAEAALKLEAMRRALDEAEQAVASGDVVDYGPDFFDRLDEADATHPRAAS